MGKNLYVKLCVYGIEKCLCRKSKRIIKDTNTYTDLMDYFVSRNIEKSLKIKWRK